MYILVTLSILLSIYNFSHAISALISAYFRLYTYDKQLTVYALIQERRRRISRLCIS